MITTSQEDYLKVIYSENLKQNKISNKFISDKLDISAPSVSAMIKKMKDGLLIKDDKNLGLTLTTNGVKEIKILLSKHRLWELFLVKHLKYTWDEVHLDADLLEHATSLNLMNKLNEYLGYPKSCPHGKTIYLNYDVEMYQDTYKLCEVKEGFSGYIRILDDDSQLLKHLSDKNIKIGLKFEVEKIDDFDNSMTLKYNNERTILSEKATNKIYVSKEQ